MLERTVRLQYTCIPYIPRELNLIQNNIHARGNVLLYLATCFALSSGAMPASMLHSCSCSWYTSNTHGRQPDPQHSVGRGFSGGSGRTVRSSPPSVASGRLSAASFWQPSFPGPQFLSPAGVFIDRTIAGTKRKRVSIHE